MIYQSKMKAFDDNEKKCMTKKLTFDLARMENIAEKGESAGYYHFSLLPLFTKRFKLRIV